MKTIKELIEEKGRDIIERMITMINETPQAHILLSQSGKDVVDAILKDGGVQLLLENGSWVTVEWGIGGQPLQTHRIREDYKLPEDEPEDKPEDESEDEPEVFWGERGVFLAPTYSRPDGIYTVWNQLAGWAEENGWEFYGFHKSKDINKMSRRPYFPFYCQHDGKVCIRPFAKFVRRK